MTSLFAPLKSTDWAGIESFNATIAPHVGIKTLWGKEAYDALRASDVVVFERIIYRQEHIVIKWLKSLGKKTFVTFDDGYNLMPLNKIVVDSEKGVLGIQGNWRGGKKAQNGAGSLMPLFREGLRMCDGALVPSKVIQEDWRRFQPNIHYIPNFLLSSMWGNLSKPPSDIITIGWGGTGHHDTSWKSSGLIPVLGQLCSQYPRLQIHIQPAYPDIVELFRKYGVRFKTGEWQSVWDWPKTVASFDIGVIPMSGSYDDRRSSLKAQELSMLGIPWVATDSPPYQDSQGGLKVNNRTSDWRVALERLITDKALYKTLSEQGRAWATGLNGLCAEYYERAFGFTSSVSGT